MNTLKIFLLGMIAGQLLMMGAAKFFDWFDRRKQRANRPTFRTPAERAEHWRRVGEIASKYQRRYAAIDQTPTHWAQAEPLLLEDRTGRRYQE